jgi:RNA polymerase sigma-70 factor, ECF subfamily
MSDFGRRIVEEIPGLRRYAWALTRNAAQADDLVQSCLLRALVKRHLWRPDTNLRSWLFTMLHNQRASEIRRAVREQRRFAAAGVSAVVVARSDPSGGLYLRDLERALGTLPAGQRQAILLVGLEGRRYEEAAKILMVPVGTIQSRVSRGRATLRKVLGFEADIAEPCSTEPGERLAA